MRGAGPVSKGRVRRRHPKGIPISDPINISWRDYGVRVGVWRITELLHRLGIRPSVLLNAGVCREYPRILEAGNKRRWAWIAHGRNNSMFGDTENSMLSYVYFGTNDLGKAITFYNATLAPLGMERCITGDPDWDRISAGWGIYEDGGARELAVWIGKPFDQRPATVGNGSMVAFRARSWKEVDDFHAAALANGGVCDGAPGLRLHYAPDFYAAYVRDPDGNKVAAVCRGITDGA